MSIAKELDFDILISGVKAQTQHKIFEILTSEAAPLCGADAGKLFDVFKLRLGERTFGMGEGVAIFDIRSSHVKEPVLALMTLDHYVDFDALDNKPINILAAVISPHSGVSSHLQCLASVSRVLRSSDLCVTFGTWTRYGFCLCRHKTG